MPHPLASIRTRMSTVVALVATIAALAACGGEAPPPTTTVQTSRPAATGTPAATPNASASTVAAGEAALAHRTSAALVGTGAYTARGYRDGTNLPAPTGPTSDVCNKQLDIDRLATTHVASARQWTGDRYVITHAVHAYAPGSAVDALNQVRAAAGACTTYDLTVSSTQHTYTLGEPVTTPPYYGIDVAYTYCERKKAAGATTQTARCTLVFAHGGLLGMLRVQSTGESTSDAYAELGQVADAATNAIQAV